MTYRIAVPAWFVVAGIVTLWAPTASVLVTLLVFGTILLTPLLFTFGGSARSTLWPMAAQQLWHSVRTEKRASRLLTAGAADDSRDDNAEALSRLDSDKG